MRRVDSKIFILLICVLTVVLALGGCTYNKYAFSKEDLEYGTSTTWHKYDSNESTNEKKWALVANEKRGPILLRAVKRPDYVYPELYTKAWYNASNKYLVVRFLYLRKRDALTSFTSVGQSIYILDLLHGIGCVNKQGYKDHVATGWFGGRRGLSGVESTALDYYPANELTKMDRLKVILFREFMGGEAGILRGQHNTLWFNFDPDYMQNLLAALNSASISSRKIESVLVDELQMHLPGVYYDPFGNSIKSSEDSGLFIQLVSKLNDEGLGKLKALNNQRMWARHEQRLFGALLIMDELRKSR